MASLRRIAEHQCLLTGPSVSAAKPVQGRPRRFGEAAGCAGCPAMLPALALAHNSLRAARCARTDAPSQLLMRAARAARAAALLGASQAHRVLPCAVFGAAPCGGGRTRPRTRARRCPAGAICAATRSAAPGSARASALRGLTRRYCLNVAPAGREVSYRRDPGASTAVQSTRSGDRCSMSPCRVPPGAMRPNATKRLFVFVTYAPQAAAQPSHSRGRFDQPAACNTRRISSP
jgi:hypothetical protein